MNAKQVWAAKVQGETLVTADHANERWTREELEYVVTHTDDERDADIALALGRSLFALWAIQHRLRSEGVEGVMARFAKRVVATCPTHHLALTAMGDCDWC